MLRDLKDVAKDLTLSAGEHKIVCIKKDQHRNERSPLVAVVERVIVNHGV